MSIKHQTSSIESGIKRRYRMAGLEIESEIPWRETPPVPARTPADIVMIDGERHGLPRPPDTNARTPDASRVRFVVPGIGRFVVEEGRRVVAWADPDAPSEDLSQQLSGSALALALMQRGTLVLHAAVVHIDGRALLVSGHSGDGKSTMAAACAAAGHTIIADDLAVLDPGPEGWTVRRMAPIVRLGSGASGSLGSHARWQADDKTVHLLPHDDTDDAVPVGGIACLEWDAQLALTPMAPVAAALALIDRAFCLPAFRQPQAEATLRQCTQLARACPVWRLTRPLDRDRIAEAVTLLADALSGTP